MFSAGLMCLASSAAQSSGFVCLAQFAVPPLQTVSHDESSVFVLPPPNMPVYRDGHPNQEMPTVLPLRWETEVSVSSSA